jgi:AcrR family transcriptional regulator
LLCQRQCFILTDRSTNKFFDMSPRTANQFKAIRKARKEKIMESALGLFAVKGFHSTSIANIAREAGMSKGLFYNYFENKEALIKELVMQGFTAILSVFDPNHDGKLTGNEMRFLIIELIEIIKKDIQFWRLYFSMLTQPPIYSLVQDQLMQMVEPIYAIIAEFFKQEGYAEPMSEAKLFSAMLDGITMNFVFDADHFPIDHVRDRLLSLYNLNQKE